MIDAPPLSGIERAERFAELVRKRDALACPSSVRAAVERVPPTPYWFDPLAAEHAIRFIELLPHVKGRWAGSRVILSDWQCWLVAQVFGWKRPDGTRLYRRAYIEVPRKNGKSFLSAAIGLYMLCADEEAGAEVYCGATSENQAFEVFTPAWQIAKRTPDLVEAYGLSIFVKNLNIPLTGSKFEPVVHDPGDGSSPHMAIVDEYHEHNDSRQWDSFLTGMGARTQPLLWTITTAGYDTSSPCYALRQEAMAAVNGTVFDDELFVLIYGLDEEDDWSSPEVLATANPNLDVSVRREYLESLQRRAVNNPREAPTFKTKHLNVWETAAAPYFDARLWIRERAGANEAEYLGTECTIGLDLASKIDLCAALRVHRDDSGYVVFPKLYLPEARVKDPENRHYYEWVSNGWITTTPGDITDYDYIEAAIAADAERFSILRVVADQHNATQLLVHLGNLLGSDIVQTVPQTALHLSEPMKEIQASIVADRIRHDGNPCMSWMMGNVTAQEDRNANVFPRKERLQHKIDGAVALILAIGAWMREPTREKVKVRWLL